MSESMILTKEQLRQLQLNELELIVEVDRICRKYGIKYSLDGGTLLGAIRHQGFIPWDDDADIIITRCEYEKFSEACKKELKKDEFFLQDYETDPYYRWGYSKMRNLKTEFVRSGQEHMKYVTGVCIDIFIVDNVPDNVALRVIDYYTNVIIRKVLYSELGKVVSPSAFLRNWYKLLNLIPRDRVFSFHKLLISFSNRKITELKNQLLFPLPKKCKYGIKSTFFDEYIDVRFEGMNFKAMKHYDEYLKLLYGNYMQLPPIEKRIGINTASCIKTFDISLEEIEKKYSNYMQSE